MTKRDIFFFVLGVLLASIGVLASVLGFPSVGFLSGLMLGVLLLIVLLLQRKQLATVQQRTLRILRASDTIDSKLLIPKGTSEKGSPKQDNVEKAIDISTKKIIGLLQAQQIQIDELNTRLSVLHENQVKSDRKWA